MNAQRNGFTLIEMIFVIIVLGILAGVSVVRMAVAAQQAEIMQRLYDVNYVMRDVQNFYTLTGKFGTFEEMTDIPLTDKKRRSIYTVEGYNCVVFRVDEKRGTMRVTIDGSGTAKSEICNGLAQKLRAAGDVKTHVF